ncbi:MAG: SDR family NAD(P)-dependent oxidoreductase [Dorea sp.]|nr:SDR family NAD(P)-dependent oxidoreductase [Dorea sp.]
MKIAVVTGASSGLGRAFAKGMVKFDKKLDEIWVIARREDRLLELKKELKLPVRVFTGDLREEAVYEELMAGLKSSECEVRVLVNAAGFGLMGDFAALSLEAQLSMIDVNCKAVTRLTGICLPYMKKGGKILPIASAAAFGPQPGFSVYAATKSYVYQYSLALRRELKKRGISVTCVCPGPVDTEFFDHTGREIKESKKKYLLSEERVVKRAFRDARKKRAVSIPGLSMKGAKLASGLLPDTWIAAFMDSRE